MEDAYRQTANAATTSLDWEAKERIVGMGVETLDKIDETRKQYRALQEENAMLRKYCENLNATANRKDDAQG
ncbi:hypothetical protein SYNPS1DRAFT_22816 [Syncephalis pseudoplumigaleata]|uniref:Uncharacterized protein n=1 Tax=Syncephalis pseudoplumigaleata TaxID=1712513 RepID=A0A4P9YYX2_9FUNG|nr:hypothetical protein SYNPS1DRAFT_22816 [Syncephalis pseudoplumigaleata]|eukprot:RKP25188.1 hypothetical protein SYNPS1DRAFT_22816 [Syncephalis pseudoplumigaleata]